MPTSYAYLGRLTGAGLVLVITVGAALAWGAARPRSAAAVEANGWSTGPDMPAAAGEVAAGIIGDTLYVVGESNSATFAFDLSAARWRSTSALARRPFAGNHHAAEVVRGKLYLFGGLGSGSGGKVQIYDPAADRWSLGADMPFAAGSSSSALINGKVYVAGGIVGASTTNRAAVYDPATDRWTEVARMRDGRNHAASATDGSRLYVFGGRGPGSGDNNTVANGFADVQIYDPATDRWVSSKEADIRPLPVGRGGMGKAVYAGGEFYVLGGETANDPRATALRVYDRVDIYNPRTNSWRTGASMLTPRHGIFPILDGDRIYVAAGGTRAGFSSSGALEIYHLAAGDPPTPSATRTPTPTSTATSTSTNTPTTTATTTPTATVTNTSTSAPTTTPTAAVTNTSTSTPTSTATGTATPSVTSAATGTIVLSPTPLLSPTPTTTVTAVTPVPAPREPLFLPLLDAGPAPATPAVGGA